MKSIAVVVFLLVLVLTAGAQDWTQFGFKAEPGVAFGTPCAGQIVARFWYQGFGISTCGIYVPKALNLFLNGSGGEADVMYRFNIKGSRQVQPYVGLGVGTANIYFQSTQVFKSDLYVAAQAGAYFNGFFAQLGLGVGRFVIAGSVRTPVFPLLQIGYTYNGLLP